MVASSTDHPRPKKVAIFGGGKGGVLTALLLAQMRDEDGHRLFKPTVYEKEAELFTGACSAAFRLHHGFEYPLDAQTAEDCLLSAIIYKLSLPPRPAIKPDFFTDRFPMSYALTNATQEAGLFIEDMIRHQSEIITEDGTRLRCRKKLFESSQADFYVAEMLDNLLPLKSTPPDYTLERWDARNDKWMPVTDRQHWYTHEGYAVRTDDSGQLLYLTRQKYLQHAQHLQQYYSQLFDQVQHLTGWTTKDTAQNLFGLPQSFYREIKDNEELPSMQREDGSHTGIGCFQSRELGFAVPYELSYYKEALRRLERKGMLKLLTHHDIQSVAKKGKGFEFAVDNSISGFQKKLKADYIISAAAEDNPAINGDLQGDKPVTVYHRTMIQLDTSKVKLPSSVRQPLFMFLGDVARGQFAGMFCPGNANTAIIHITHDQAAYRGGEATLTTDQPRLPPEWFGLKKGYTLYEDATPEEQEAMDTYLDFAIELFPLLTDAVIESKIEEVTSNFQSSKERREHENSREIAPGHVVVYPTKATHAYTCALEACGLLHARLQSPDLPAPIALPPEYALHQAIALRGTGRGIEDFALPPQKPEKLSHALSMPKKMSATDPTGEHAIREAARRLNHNREIER